MAPRIKLRADLVVRAVQRNDLVPYEIVTRLQARGDRVIHAGIGNADERRQTPLIFEPVRRGGVQAVLGDFEPGGRWGGGRGVGVES